jgi:hypothetical protein
LCFKESTGIDLDFLLGGIELPFADDFFGRAAGGVEGGRGEFGGLAFPKFEGTPFLDRFFMRPPPPDSV